MAVFKARIDRLDRLEAAIPRFADPEACPDPATLLDRLHSDYTHHANRAAKLRAIQRDLSELIEAERIDVINPKQKPKRYRRRCDHAEFDPLLKSYIRRKIENILSTELALGRLDAAIKRLLRDEDGELIGEDKLLVISDTQRLLPAAIREDVFADVLEALVRSRSLQVGYRDAHNKTTHPVIHPQALLQRGPRLYLFAQKNDEDSVRMYALHRILNSAIQETPAREARGFSLAHAVSKGNADFGQGQQIDLVIRARGYAADLLLECALAKNQRIQDEPEGSDFDVLVSATVPSTGQLLRWLLGFSDKIEVIAPLELREVVAAQISKAGSLYSAERISADTYPSRPV